MLNYTIAYPVRSTPRSSETDLSATVEFVSYHQDFQIAQLATETKVPVLVVSVHHQNKRTGNHIKPA